MLKTPDIDRLEKIAGQLLATGEKASSEAQAIITAIAKASNAPPHRPAARPAAAAAKPAPPVAGLLATSPRRSVPPVDGDFRPSSTQQRILDALRWYESIGISAPSNLQLGAIAMIDTSGGHFSNTAGPLSSNGLIERGPGTTRLTDAGRALANMPERISTMDDYHEMLRRRVRRARSASNRTVDVLNVMIAAGGGDVTAEEIGEALGIDHTGGHFSNTVGPLSTLGLVERHKGVFHPTEILFPDLD